MENKRKSDALRYTYKVLYVSTDSDHVLESPSERSNICKGKSQQSCIVACMELGIQDLV